MLKTEIDVEQVAIIFKLLSDKTRLTMVKILNDHSVCVCEFVELFKMSQPAISQHLRKLKQAEIVKEEKKSQWVYYSINKAHPYYPFINQILVQLPDQKYRFEELKAKGINLLC